MESRRWYAAHGALAQGVERLRERLSLVPGTRDQEQVGVKRGLSNSLPARAVLLELYDLMAKGAEGFGYVLLGRILRLVIANVCNPQRLKTKLGDPVLPRTWPPSTTFKF
jgi:hypothetical protein